MTDYTKTTDFTSKDSLPSGDSGKIIRGAEFGTEFDNIETAVNSKSNIDNPAFTGNITVTGTVDGRDIAADGTKLDTIETSADVTDTANVTAAGALMDSELTDITAVKALNQGVATTDSPTFAAVTSTGNVTVGGTVDGRDVAADGTKLDGIEAGATADQTAAQIKTAYESNADTNAFTDADHTKLDGIEALADVTDTANVTAAGALMDSELTSEASVKALNQGVATTDSPTFDGLTVDSSDVTIATFQRDGGGSPGSFGGYGIKFNAANSTLGDDYYLGINIGGQFSLSTHSDFLSSIFDITSTGIDVNGTVEFNGLSGTGAVTVTDILDQDDMSGNSATALATQQSIKAYVDSQVGTVDTLAEVLANGNATGGTDIAFGDNDKAIFGAGSDLQIYHDGTHSNIKESGAGDLQIFGDNVNIYNAAGSQNLINLTSGGANTLFYAGSAKLATTATGIDVTGAVTVDTSSVGGFKVTNEATSGVRLTAYQGSTNSNVRTAYVDSQEFVVSTGAPTGTTVTERFRIDSSGNVGIGTSSPVGRLDVSGGADGTIGSITLAQGNTTSKVAKIYGTSVNTNEKGIRFNTFHYGDVDAVTITSNGNVGIGTSSPNDKVDISGSTGDGYRLTDGTHTGVYRSISGGTILKTASNHALLFGTNDTERMRIDASGNVGIGASSPVSISGYTITTLNNSSSGSALYLQQAAATKGRVITTANELTIDTTAAIPLVFGTNNTERMRIDSSGDVGIGTDSPDTSLHISEASSATATVRLESTDTTLQTDQAVGVIEFEHNDSSGVPGVPVKIGAYAENNHGSVGLRFYTGIGNTAEERVRVDHDGNVGIGTSAPTHNLSIGGVYQSVNTDLISITDTATIYRGTPDGTGFEHAKILSGRDASTFTYGSFLSFYTEGKNSGTTDTSTERMRIDSSGNVGIGVTSPQGPLHVYGSEYAYIGPNVAGVTPDSATGGIAIGWNKSSGQGESIIAFNKGAGATGGLVFANNDGGTYNERMRIDSSGNLILSGNGGSTSNSVDISYNGSSGQGSFNADSNSGNTFLTFGTSSSGSLAERMRLDDSGNLMVGTAGTPNGTSVYGSGFFNTGASGLVQWLSGTSTATTVSVARFYNPNGNVGSIQLNGSATSYVTSSDQRLKDNIVDAPSASDDIDAIQVRSFDWKADGSHQKYGMVAQELQSVAPEAVSTPEDSEEMMGVDYSKLVPMLVKEIQSLRARVAQLETN